MPHAVEALVCALALSACAVEDSAGRPWVRNLTFEGVHSVSSRALADRLAVERTPWVRHPKRFLDPTAVEIDRDRVEAFYRAHGFFDVQVHAEVLPRSSDSVEVRFIVDEGQPTRIATVEAPPGFPLASGEIFEHARYLAARDGLADQLRRKGHAWAQVRGEVEVDRKAHQAHVRLWVDEGPLVRFGRLRVAGTERVSAANAAEYADLQEGALFDPQALDDAQARLRNLRLFSAVRVEHRPHPGDPSVADVIVHVREGAFNDLRLGVGFGFEVTRTEVFGTLFYQRRNWLGGLRTLELQLDPGWVAVPAFWDPQRNGPSLHTKASLIQPMVRGQLRLTAGYDVDVDYAYQYHGPQASFLASHNWWRERLSVGVSYHFEYLLFFNTDPVLLDNPSIAGRLFGYTNPYRLGWFQQDLSLDLRDQPLDARRGVYLRVGLEQGGLYAGGAFLYEKIDPELRLYAPLGSRVTVAGRFWFGQLWAQGDFGSPITRRFYLGGANSHRGFNYDRLSPQIPSGLEGVAAVPVGGDQMVLMSVELRVAVAKPFGRWLSLAVFTDGGDVGGPSCAVTAAGSCGSVSTRTSVDWGDLNWAVGGGARYRTPIGTVRLDVGVRLNRLSPTQPDGTPNPDPGDRVAFHLSLGEAF